MVDFTVQSVDVRVRTLNYMLEEFGEETPVSGDLIAHYRAGRFEF